MAWLGTEGEDGGLVAGLWQALLAAVAAAFMSWLWFGGGGGGGGGGEGQRKKAEEPKGDTRGAQDPFQRTADGVLSETKHAGCVSSPQEPLENHVTPSGDHPTPDGFIQSPEIEAVLKDPIIPFVNHTEYLRSEAPNHPKTTSELPQIHEAEAREERTSDNSGDNPEEKLNQDSRPETLDPEDVEAARKPRPDDVGNKEAEQGKRIAAVPPMPQTVHVVFRVHYVTRLEAQQIAVTGDHECLGQWHHYIPLRCDKDGFWSDSVVLPFDTSVEWKFILVESGKVVRWEECANRRLVTEHEDQVAHKSWGYH